ncbi:hypothetical protein C4580_04400 [Candidatus Woesearchaeota archaeon]|nr:MAG: hypothetical protein C4580_04400 [Candidatus Woesearchaeota archaeon]
MINDPLLFSTEELSAYLSRKERQLKQQIDEFTSDYILHVDLAELKKSLFENYEDFIPELMETIEVTQSEVQIQTDSPQSAFWPDHKPALQNGTRMTFHVPFEGNASFFQYTPSTRNLRLPKGVVQDSELVVNVDELPHRSDEFRKEFNKNIADVKIELDRLRAELITHYKSIPRKIDIWVNSRWSKCKDDEKLTLTVGFPLKKRKDAPKTYTAPLIRKKLPTVQLKEGSPELVLEEEHYEHILTIVTSMAHVMERSPRAFEQIQEEDLRVHFLVQLNGQYEGQATGETFNFGGKTDIIVRINDKNIFIAECKFWSGEKRFTETIEQLLKYTSWRDTKTAIILFNRNKNFSEVLKQIPAIVQSHPNFKEELEHDETTFRFKLHQNDDKEKLIHLTVVAFDVPSVNK